VSKFVGRRKAKEWNLIGALFDAHTAERHDLANRVGRPRATRRRSRRTRRRDPGQDAKTITTTKYFLDRPPIWTCTRACFRRCAQRGTDRTGILAFADPELRAKRHKSRDFWQDRETVS